MLRLRVRSPSAPFVTCPCHYPGSVAKAHDFRGFLLRTAHRPLSPFVSVCLSDVPSSGQGMGHESSCRLQKRLAADESSPFEGTDGGSSRIGASFPWKVSLSNQEATVRELHA